MDTNNRQDKVLKFGVIILCVVVALLIIRDGLAFGGRYNETPISSLPSIAVNGQGKAQAIPDVSRFTFDVRKEAKTVQESQKAVSDILNPLIEAFENAGVDEKDIKTVSYNFYPQYDYMQAGIGMPGRQVLRGYETVASIEVTVRDTSKAGEMVTLAGTKGATGISQTQFVVDDPLKVQAEARQEAIRDAREKAEQLAKDLDVRLGRIVSFSESTGGVMPPYYGMRDMAVSNEAGGSPAPDLPTGQNEYQVTVSIQYEIK